MMSNEKNLASPTHIQEDFGTHEKGFKERLYQSIVEAYGLVMNSGSAQKFLGYNSGVGFDMKGLDFVEPQLQKLLSLLHLKKNHVNAATYTALITHLTRNDSRGNSL